MRNRLRELLGDRRGDRGDKEECRCRLADESGGEVVLEATDCPGAGRLAVDPDCRETAVAAAGESGASVVKTATGGRERVYEGEAAALLGAAGRFAIAVEHRDERLADRARRDPLGAAREATGRAGPAADLAIEAGLAAAAEEVDGYAALTPRVGPTISRWRTEAEPPAATLIDRRELSTGAVVRRYRTPSGPDRYHLEPLAATLSSAETETLVAARDRLAGDSACERTPRAAVRAVAGDEASVGVLKRVLAKHTRGYDLLEDVLADRPVSDVFLTPPAGTPLRVTVGGDRLVTNVRPTAAGISALESTLRLESGRPFSRAAPTIDARIEIGDRTVRVAGVTDPTSDGTGFAFRGHDPTAWTLAELLSRDGLSPAAAGLLSVAVERGRSVLLAGPRGAGKTTTLGALLWEVPTAVRQVLIEDTPELPVEGLREAGRDIQRLQPGPESLSPARALRTALRLGDGALVVGEVRGEEAAVLYEAMRVGANSEAVLGTIHGADAPSVRERVVADLGVSPTAFGATDLVVTLGFVDGGRGVRTIEELHDHESFAPLFRREDGALVQTPRIDRGNSRLVAALAESTERYADVRERLQVRARTVGTLAAEGRTETPAFRADAGPSERR